MTTQIFFIHCQWNISTLGEYSENGAYYVYATYNELMKNSWRMKEIDEMYILGFLCQRA